MGDTEAVNVWEADATTIAKWMADTLHKAWDDGRLAPSEALQWAAVRQVGFGGEQHVLASFTFDRDYVAQHYVAERERIRALGRATSMWDVQTVQVQSRKVSSFGAGLRWVQP